ncbi:hypothetical protein IAR50_003521 [Cryptococcus sp. DSM 104548]
MTRRSPPSHLILLPTHIPTPPRGAPKFHLPLFPCSLPTTHTPPPPPELMSEKQGDERNKVAPWVRSRGFDQAGREMGVDLKRVLRPLEGAVVMRR